MKANAQTSSTQAAQNSSTINSIIAQLRAIDTASRSNPVRAAAIAATLPSVLKIVRQIGGGSRLIGQKKVVIF